MPGVTWSRTPRSLVGALLVTVLTIAGPVPVGATAADPSRTLVVDSSDPTAYATIGGAVAAARDGDTVLVRPGRYVEGVALDKAISVEGDPDRSVIVIEGPALPAFHILADGAGLRGLTLTGGRPWPEEEAVPAEDHWQYACLALSADASATDLVISDGAAHGIRVLDSAAPTIGRNDVHGNELAGVFVTDSATPTISDNDIRGNESGGIWVQEGATATVDGRVVTGPYME